MSSAARRGRLKVFFGAAPGVGKTYAMLLEAHDLQEQGKDVVIGLVESHKRAATAALTAGLPTVPLKVVRYRTGRIREVNVEAIIARKPDIVLIDELAHTITHSDQPQSAEGNEGALHAARHTKRWQDIEQILDAGIDVISTLNIQHLESLNDVVFDITGKRQRETVPDWVVREADDVELVDLGPDALQVRLRDGLIYRPEQVDAALANYFSIGNLIALRELALLWMADKVDEGLEKYRADENIDKTLPARERLVVAVEGTDFSPVLIRRAARMAGRMKGRELHAVYVAADTGLTGISQSRLTELRRLTESLGGTWHTVTGGDVPQAIIGFATMINATQIVVGASRSLWRERLFGPGVSSRVIAGAGSIDVCIVSQRDQARRSVRWRGRSAMTWQRRVLACVVGGVWSLLTTVVVGLWGFGASEFSLAPVGCFAGVVFAARRPGGDARRGRPEGETPGPVAVGACRHGHPRGPQRRRAAHPDFAHVRPDERRPRPLGPRRGNRRRGRRRVLAAGRVRRRPDRVGRRGDERPSDRRRLRPLAARAGADVGGGPDPRRLRRADPPDAQRARTRGRHPARPPSPGR